MTTMRYKGYEAVVEYDEEALRSVKERDEFL